MSSWIRVVLIVMVLTLVPIYSALAQVPTLQFTISPTSGAQGTPITVTGQGAQAGLPVQVMLVTDGDTGMGMLAQVQVEPDAAGNFTATLTVPADAREGRYAVRAEQRGTWGLIHYYWTTFTIGPAVMPVAPTVTPVVPAVVTPVATPIVMPVTGGQQDISSLPYAIFAALLVLLIAGQGARSALRQR
ncbi:MAG: hypothetical protein NZ765_02265 [Anaerolineae bacterium]|nr:hypothetical protein [Anaerolineae bacterium]MDW8070026.1 hypothetical protein [Anaerolineae bacterium]